MKAARPLRIAGLFLLGLAETQAMPLPQSDDSQKNYPNVLAPLYEFGRRGSELGALRLPSGLAVGKEDLLYVADAGNHRIQIFAMNGQCRGAFGSCGKGPSEFLFPSVVAADPGGRVLVADAVGRLQAFSAEGKFLKEWTGLRSPRGIAASSDRIYVAEGDTHQIRVLSWKDGSSVLLGGLGSTPGRFLAPTGLAVDEDGVLYVADTGNHRIQKLDAQGKPLAEWGAWGAPAGLLSYPAGLGYSNGRVYVADRCNHRVQVFDRSGALLRQWGSPPVQPGDGKGRLHYPEGLAVSPSGGLTIVSEPAESRIQVFVNRDLARMDRVNDLPWWDSIHARLHAVRLAPPPPGCRPQWPAVLASPEVHAVFFFDISSNALGPLVTVGGFGRKLGELNGIGGVAVDGERGRAYISDCGNRRIVLLELQRDDKRPELFSSSLRVISSHLMERLIPNPPPEYSPSAALPGPLFRDSQGRIYLLDRGNSVILVCNSELKFIRMVQVSPTTQEIAVGPDGTIYATDPPAFQVKVYEPGGQLKLSWGRRGEQAEDAFLMPFGITLDDKGFVYVTDPLQDAVKKFDVHGRFVKRWGERGELLRPDRVALPKGIAFYKPDRLIIEDFGNHRALLCNVEGEWLGSYVSGGLATPIAIR